LDKNVKDIAKDLFIPPSRGATLTLAGPSLAKKSGKTRKGKEKEKDKEEKRFNNTLPDDMHFSSKQLVTLFLKPKFSVRELMEPLIRARLMYSLSCSFR
jgi:condensin complex subunit 2